MDDRDGLPPLVAPGAPLSALRTERYSRTLRLPGFGSLAQQRLQHARVLVVGAGGLGSAVLPALTAAGFGTIGIIDDDLVESSNLPRQTIHAPTDIGRSKIDSAVDTLRGLDPETVLLTFDTRLTTANALEILAGFDLVIDGSDNFPTRYLTNDAAALTGIPVVWGAVHQFGGQAGLSWAERGPQYRDLFPEPPAPGTVPSCAEAGVLPAVCAVIGGLLVAQAVTLVTGVGESLLGRVIIFDSLRSTFREVAYSRDPLGAPITGLIDYELFCGVQADSESASLSATGAISPRELRERLDRGEALTLIDVREPWEAALSSIAGSALVPLGDLEFDVEEDAPAVVEALRDATIVLYCHHGPRSDQAQQLLAEAGLPHTLVLTGGIDAWASEIDPTLARY